MRKITAVVALLTLIVAASLWARPAAADASPSISVSATMVTQVPPDVVVWNINLTNRAATLKEAKAAADAATAGVLGAVKELNAAPADVQTSQLSAHPEGGRDFWGRPVTKGWSICRSITVNQRDLARFDDFFTKLVNAADVEVNYHFESSRYHELRKETRVRAAKAAREKAQVMVEAVGGTLGPPVSVAEGVSWNGTPGSGGVIDPKTNGSITIDWPANGTAGVPAAEDTATGTLAPGMTEIRETVSVTYKFQ